MARPPLDLSLYLVTDTALCGTYGVPDTVAAAVRAGVSVVQLRDPWCSDAELVNLGREVAARLVGTGVRLLINDRVDLVAEIGADGAHVGQGDIGVQQARALLGPTRYLGLSVQTLDQVQAQVDMADDTADGEADHEGEPARGGRAAIDYLGVGPVWPQTTKSDAGAAIGLDALGRVVRASPWPCVAIGGIGPGRVKPVRQTGAVGVAVVSAICGRADPAAATRALRTEWQGSAPRTELQRVRP